MIRLVLLLICIKSVTTMNLTVKVGVILIEKLSEPFDIDRIGPVLSIAFENIQTDFGITFKPIYRNYTGRCPYEKPLGILSELYYLESIEAVIGPACSQGAEASGRLAHYLGIPMVSGLADLTLRNENFDTFRTLTKLSYNLRKISYSMSSIMHVYDWHHVTILYDDAYVMWRVVGRNLAEDFREIPNIARPYDLPFDPAQIDNYRDMLSEARRHSRVIIVLCFAECVRAVMYDAYLLGMAGGEYVFLTLELFESPWFGFYRQFLRDDSKDAGVSAAYQSLMIVTLTTPNVGDPEFKAFEEAVKQRALDEFGYKFTEDDKVHYVITAFYDSALYLANAYNVTMHEGGDVKDGVAVAQKLWNSTFQGINGPVAIDHRGERVADFDLLKIISPASKQFEIVGRFRGALLEYHPIKNTKDVWPNGIPLDMPECGFTGSWCVPDKTRDEIVIIAVTTGCVAVGAAVVILLMYRKLRLQQSISRRSWLVDIAEVAIRTDMCSIISWTYTTPRLLQGHPNEDEEQTYGKKVGYYRSYTVMVKKLLVHSLDITRKIEVEFHEMQSLSHPNLAKFIGACVDPGNMCLLSELAPRGSLQDILQHDDIQLDWNFRYSLISDVIKGMRYIHGSTIHVHGRLSSSNCVIDSRFMLKLTDYGLPSLFVEEKREQMKRAMQEDSNIMYRKLLWTAPEHLRSLKKWNAMHPSQPGDVYSFGIILQEIISRSGPYEDNTNVDVSPEEIVKRLTEPLTEPFRPSVEAVENTPEIIDLMQQCWAENPADRPTFAVIEITFRTIRAGKPANIMDNLLQRMSDYADNLEQLASERTKMYLDEKQKIEDLLHKLLPESVARQLQAGNTVKPEFYDTVTVYFSDIVEFTTLASHSTPIEVVDFLNELFTKFDMTVHRFNVYKVETIGDAYMVVSGLPERNGTRHVVEICGMALAMIDVVLNFSITHMPGRSLKIRIGIHSGPVVAGVVGNTMPRYCLFGDTVNTASRMESTSEPLRIHISKSTNDLLEEFPTFVTEERGETEIKGKGKMVTYWLKGTAGPNKSSNS